MTHERVCDSFGQAWTKYLSPQETEHDVQPLASAGRNVSIFTRVHSGEIIPFLLANDFDLPQNKYFGKLQIISIHVSIQQLVSNLCDASLKSSQIGQVCQICQYMYVYILYIYIYMYIYIYTRSFT